MYQSFPEAMRGGHTCMLLGLLTGSGHLYKNRPVYASGVENVNRAYQMIAIRFVDPRYINSSVNNTICQQQYYWRWIFATIEIVDILTVDDVAKELDVTPGWVRQLCYEGRLGKKIGRQWLITREELDSYKTNRRPPGRPHKIKPKDIEET